MFDEYSSKMLDLMPGPVTIIVPERLSVPETITQLPSVRMTCPDEKAWALVNRANFPIVCSPANKAEGKAAVDFVGAVAEFGTEVGLIIDGGVSKRGAAGTFIDFSQPGPTVLRTGPFPVPELRAAPDGVAECPAPGPVRSSYSGRHPPIASSILTARQWRGSCPTQKD